MPHLTHILSPLKQRIYLIPFLVLAGCGQKNPEQPSKSLAEPVSDTAVSNNPEKASKKPVIEENPGEGSRQSLSEFDKATPYPLTDTITADFNGDGFLDKAFYKKEDETSGIIIRHGGQAGEEVRIGFGQDFSIWPEFNCNWLDYWGLVKDRETTEATFTEEGDILGSRDVKLQNPSIALGANELGGGLITFLNGKYVWIHQTC